MKFDYYVGQSDEETGEGLCPQVFRIEKYQHGHDAATGYYAGPFETLAQAKQKWKELLREHIRYTRITLNKISSLRVADIQFEWDEDDAAV